MPCELDTQCAQALGYTVYHYDKDYAENCYYMLMDAQFNPVVSMFKGARQTEAEAWGDAPMFSADPEAAHLLEDEIERRDLQRSYIVALLSGVGSDVEYAATHVWYADAADFWRMLRATPEQRARAFLEVVKQ